MSKYVTIPTTNKGDVSLPIDDIYAIYRSNGSTSLYLKGQGFGGTGLPFVYANSETGSNATYDAFKKAIFEANPGGNTTVQLPSGQTLTA